MGENYSCWICGGKATKTRDLTENKYYDGELISIREIPDKYQRCYCEKCYAEYMKTLKEENALFVKLKQKRMFEQAVRRMEHQR